MSTIGGLLLPQFQPYDLGRTLTQATNIQGGQLSNQTRLLELAELRRQQEAQALARAYYQQNPGALLEGQAMPQSILGSPSPAPWPPGGPMTQQTTTGGQPHAAPQVVPGGQDLSQFATPGGPPTSVLGALGPQPQAHPLMDLMRQNPDAAFAVQQRQLQTQDLALKRDEQRLTMGTKVIEYVGRQAQGVTDQAGLDAMRQDLSRLQLHQYAAQLPQWYSKEAMAPFIAKALDVKESLTLQIGEMKARADQIRAGLAGRTDAVNTELEIMGLAPATVSSLAQQGDPQAKAQLAEATNRAEQRQVRIHKSGVTPQIVEGEGGIKYSIDPHTLERRPIPSGPPGTATTGTGVTGAAEPMRGPMSPDDKKIADYADRMNRGQKQLTELEESGDYTSWKAPVANLPGGRLALSDKQQQYENAKGLFLQGILRRDSQGQISAQEWTDYGRTYFPQPGEGPEIAKQKRAMREGALKAQEAILGRPGVPQAKPQAQSSAGTDGQGGGNTFNDADIATTMANPRNKGKTRQQIIDGLLAKGMTHK